MKVNAAYFLKLADRAANAAAALSRWAKAGFPVVSEGEFNTRIEICRQCPHWQDAAVIPTCAQCGCTAIKLEFATEKCPLGKWPA